MVYISALSTVKNQKGAVYQGKNGSEENRQQLGQTDIYTIACYPFPYQRFVDH